MYEVSSLFKQYISDKERQFKIKAAINSKTYDMTSIVSCTFEEMLTGNSTFSIGSVVPSKMMIKIKTNDIIPPNARIEPFLQLTGSDGDTDPVPMGTFYVDKRYQNKGVFEFVSYDKLMNTNQVFDSSLTYPVAMVDALTEILGILDLTLDSSTVINPAYMIPYKDEEITIREMLSYIASSHSGCFKMSKENKLKLIQPSVSSTVIPISRSLYTSAKKTNPTKTITKLRCVYNDDGEYLEIGDGDEKTVLEFYNPFITESILVDVYNKIKNFTYIPMILKWKGNPAIEVGDKISISEITSLSWEGAGMAWENAHFRWDGQTAFQSVILEQTSTFKGGFATTSTADSDTEQESEFPFEGQLPKIVRKMIQKEVPYYGVTIGQTSGLKIKRSDNLSEVTMNSDILEYKVEGQKQFYLDTEARKLIFDGTIYARNLQIGGAYGTISFGELSDTENIVDADDLSSVLLNYVTNTTLGNTLSNYATAAALEDYVTNGEFSDTLASYVTNSSLTTKLGQDYIITGKILANQIASGTISGVTIDITTNATFGDSIRLGTSSSNIELSKTSYGFYLSRNSDKLLKFYSNALWIDGNIALPAGCSLGYFENGIDSSYWSSFIDFYSSYISVRQSVRMNDYSISGVSTISSSTSKKLYINSNGGGINIDGSGYLTGVKITGSIGFFGGTPSPKTSITDLSTSATPEQTRDKVIALINALQSYNLI